MEAKQTNYRLHLLDSELNNWVQSIKNDKILRLFAVECASLAFTYCGNGDPRSLAAIEIGRLYAEGNVNEDELNQAYGSTKDATEIADEVSFDAYDAFEEGRASEEVYRKAFAAARAAFSAEYCCLNSAIEAANDAVYEAWAALLAAAQSGNQLGGLVSPEATEIVINTSVVEIFKNILRELTA